MLSLFFSTFLISSNYGFECIYEVSNGQGPPYILNLTNVSEWTLEKTIVEDDRTYYYTPCRNGLKCQQGNVDFSNNVAQYIPGANQCNHYLSVDNKERPIYNDNTASFTFKYQDGELCPQTQQPRTTNIYWTCAENGPSAFMDRVQEMSICDYHITIESSLACIPENTRNANCQYRVTTQSGEQKNLNLAPLRDIDPLRFNGNNGYRIYYSPCQNGLNCYQQSGQRKVMSLLDNTITGSCDRYLSTWQNGNHKPIYSALNGGQYQFIYYNGQPCDNGAYGSEERITYLCDKSIDTAKTINVTLLSECRIDYFVATKLACDSSYDQNGNLIVSL